MAAALLLGAAALLGLIWFLLPYDTRRLCGACGARFDAAAFCPACGAEAKLFEAHPGTGSYGFRSERLDRRVHAPVEGEQDPSGGFRNKGVTRRMLVLATLAMVVGLAVRAAGLLGVTAERGGSHSVEALVTIVGGAIAFVGFVFLDAA